jgi:hypothetical protein
MNTAKNSSSINNSSFVAESKLQMNLKSPVIINQFADSFAQLQRKWQLKSPGQRRVDLKNMVDQALNAVGVSSVEKFNVLPLSSDTKIGKQGEFSVNRWEINMNQALLSQEQLSNKDAIQLASFIYHETRHAEQFFRIAQLLSSQPQPPNGQPLTAQQIYGKTLIPPSVARKAPALMPEQLAQANKLYQSVFGSGRSNREAVLVKWAATGNTYRQALQDYQQAIDRDDKNPGSVPAKKINQLLQEAQKLYEIAQAATQAYRNLPEEDDAYQTDALLRKVYLQKISGNKSTSDKETVHNLADYLTLSPPPPLPEYLPVIDAKTFAHQLNPQLVSLVEETKKLQESLIVQQSAAVKNQQSIAESSQEQQKPRPRQQLER